MAQHVSNTCEGHGQRRAEMTPNLFSHWRHTSTGKNWLWK